MVAFAQESLTGRIDRFVNDVQRFQNEVTERWLVNALVHHYPLVFTGQLPLTEEQMLFVSTRCEIQCGGNDQAMCSVLMIDGEPVAMLAISVSDTGAVQARWNLQGKVQP